MAVATRGCGRVVLAALGWRSSMTPLSRHEADKIADSFHPINGIVGDFDPELIFNRHHQFEAVEPIGPKISEKMRPVRHTFDVDVQKLGDETADLGGLIVGCEL